MLKVLVVNLLAVVVFITFAYVIAYRRQRLDTVDIAWGIGFILLAWSSWLQQHNSRSLLLAILVSIWGIRLAVHISRRSIKNSEDRRYTELTKKWHHTIWFRAFFSIYVVQAVLIWLIALPLGLATGRQLNGLVWLSLVGAIIWTIGFIFEAIADRQLRDFLSQPNHPKNMETGLWRYSRHPNYFGELVQWWGIAVVGLQVSYGWIGLLGPLVLTYLIIFVSGIPPIERHRLKDPSYHAYQQRTSVLIPLPPK